MMKYLTFIAPLLVKAPRKNPAAVLSGFAAMGLLVALGSLALIIGIWYVIALRIGVDVAWLAVGAIMLVGAFILFQSLKVPVKQREPVAYDIKTDPIGELIPDELLKDPIIAKVLGQINEHPMGSMAAATALGTLVGQELFKTEQKVVLKTS